MEDEHLWNQIMELTPLKRWGHRPRDRRVDLLCGRDQPVYDRQSLLIDGGEAGRTQFIWPE